MANPSPDFESLRRHHIFGHRYTGPRNRERTTALPRIHNTLPTHSDRSAWPIRLARVADMDALLLGVQPRDMDDKWCVWADGPTDGQVVLHMVRSWTGYEIVQLRLTATRDEESGQWTPEAGRVVEFTWSTDSEMVRWNREGAMKQARGVLTYVMGIEIVEEQAQEQEQEQEEPDSATEQITPG